MARRGLALAIALMIALSASPASAGASRNLFGRVNHARIAAGLHRLSFDRGLFHVARRNNLAMDARRSLFDATPPCSYGGANAGVTAAGRHPVRRLHRAFMRSATHRANVLNPGFHRVGVSVYRAHGYAWASEVFCS